MWREDGRCGARWKLPDGKTDGQCNPDVFAPGVTGEYPQQAASALLRLVPAALALAGVATQRITAPVMDV